MTSLMSVDEDEVEYIKMLGLNLACQKCMKQGDFGRNCWLCPDRPFGSIPCCPGLHCWDEEGGPCGEGGYCELTLVCDLICEIEGPLADLAKEMFGGKKSQTSAEQVTIIPEAAGVIPA